MSEAKPQSPGGSARGRIARKLLMPLVATVVSAAASYAARRGPELFEQKVLPKLREAGRGSGRAAANVTKRTKTTLDSAGDLAEGLTERVRTVAERAAPGDRQPGRPSLSPEQRERVRAERAARRAARRRGPSS